MNMTQRKRTNTWVDLSEQDRQLLKIKAVQYGMSQEALLGNILRQFLEDEPPKCNSWDDYMNHPKRVTL